MKGNENRTSSLSEAGKTCWVGRFGKQSSLEMALRIVTLEEMREWLSTGTRAGF